MTEIFPYYDYVLTRGNGFHPVARHLPREVARRPLDGLGARHVTPPFSNQPLDAVMAAHTSAGLVLGALVWLRRFRPGVSSALFAMALAVAVAAPVAGEFFRGIGVTDENVPASTWLKASIGLATIAVLVTRRWRLAATAVVGAGALWKLVGYIKDSDLEMTGTVLGFLGVLVGVHYRLLPADPLRETAPASVAGDAPAPAEPAPGPARPWARFVASPAAARLWRRFFASPERNDDMAAFVIGTLAGAVACRVVLHGWTDSGDEFADTFQAALFAKLRAYGTTPHCSEAFRSFWVFQYMGRTFAQYTPGWPYFMAPFVALHLTWLAGPASLGLLAAGVGRLTRRAASGFSRGDAPPDPATVRAAGRLAVAALLLSATVLINGGSRYPHVFSAALFAWSIEALLADRETRPARRSAVRLGRDAGWVHLVVARDAPRGRGHARRGALPLLRLRDRPARGSGGERWRAPRACSPS